MQVLCDDSGPAAGIGDAQLLTGAGGLHPEAPFADGFCWRQDGQEDEVALIREAAEARQEAAPADDGGGADVAPGERLAVQRDAGGKGETVSSSVAF